MKFLKWRLLGGGFSASRLAKKAALNGFTEQTVKLLRQELEKLWRHDANLGEAVLRFVILGGDDRCLEQLTRQATRGSAPLTEFLLSTRTSYCWEPAEERKEFFARVKVKDPGFYVRLGKVYEAAALGLQVGSIMDWVDGFPVWLEMLFREGYVEPDKSVYPPDFPSPMDAGLIEAMLRMEDHPADFLLRAALHHVDENDWNEGPRLREAFACVPCMGEAAGRYPHQVRLALETGKAAARTHVMKLLSRWEAETAPFAKELALIATAPAKGARELAGPFFRKLGQEGLLALTEVAESGAAANRLHAVKMLGELGGKDLTLWLQGRLEQERSAKVKAEIHRLLSAGQELAEREPPLVLPPLESPHLNSGVPQALRPALERLAEDHNKQERTQKKNYPQYEAHILTGAWVDETLVLVATLDLRDPKTCRLIKGRLQLRRLFDIIEELVKTPGLDLRQVVRLLAALGYVTWHNDQPYLELWCDFFLSGYRRTAGATFGLREVGMVCEAVGISIQKLSASYLRQLEWGTPLDWGPDAVWPFFAEDMAPLRAALGHERQPWDERYYEYEIKERCLGAFKVLATFPRVPAEFRELLWSEALEGAKVKGGLARAALRNEPGLEARIIESLDAGKQDTRVVAARWLAHRKCAVAAGPLRRAARKEKSDAAKAAMLSALEVLGEDLEEFFNPAKLLTEADKGLKKGLHKDLVWIERYPMPAVHWRGTGEPVQPKSLLWLLALTHKLKSPEPGPMLRRYLEQFQADEAEAFAQWVLETWIAQDTILPSREQALEAARQYAKQWSTVQQMQEELAKDVLPGFLQTPTGSNIKSKGILAIAGAGCRAGGVHPIERYLKAWYGMRASQCKALVRTLAWIEHPSATQLLLSVAIRFRTAGIRKEAESAVQELARRRGWTMDELADRTIPTAELDEAGELVLHTGPRALTVRLDQELKLALFREDGSRLKSFPAPRKDENPDQVKKAKRTLSGAKKQVKAVLKLQQERLYEAMCTQRSWRLEEWDRYLNKHPIVGRYCQRIVWGRCDEQGRAVQTFRPLGDGTLTDSEDEELKLDADAVIRVAHSCVVSEAEEQRWQTHLEDYEVAPLIQQFGRERHVLTPDSRDAEQLGEFEGHMVKAFSLRGLAKKAGYIRGETEDGGWFYESQITGQSRGRIGLG